MNKLSSSNSPIGNRDLIRAINRSLILNTIKEHGAISRAEIARYVGLSPATVTGISAELIQDELVFEKESGDSSGGRRPIMLAINPRGGFVVGIKVMEDHALGALNDLEATLLVKETHPFTETNPEAVAEGIHSLVVNLLKQGDIPNQKLMGVGIGLAGIIDSEQGIVRQSPYFGWRNVFLRDMIQEKIHSPVYMDNDVNTLTYAEKWFGGGQGINDFLVVTFGRGVGLGIMANGQLYHGSGGGAGEFGHTVVRPGGLLCSCGKRGCLEAYASEPALLLQAAAAFENAQLSRLPQFPSELVALAEAGEVKAQAIFADAGEMLGQAIANLVNLFNPKRILINGEGVRAGHWLFDPMIKAVDDNTMPGLRSDAEIRIEPLGDDAWAHGAASLVLHKLFESPVNNRQNDLA